MHKHTHWNAYNIIKTCYTHHMTAKQQLTCTEASEVLAGLGTDIGEELKHYSTTCNTHVRAPVNSG